MAPGVWGMSDPEYRQKADLWPLNPDGELINWTIVESKEGLAHVREIAAVKGIGVLWPGAGTLRGVFSTTNAAGERVVDTAAHENAIQQVLAACKEFGCVYLHAVGGAAQVLAECVKKVRNVYFLDKFGSPEAIWELDVRDFPAVVTMDSHGNSLHQEVFAASQAELAKHL